MCSPSCVVLNQVMSLFFNFGLFYTQPIYFYYIFLSAISPAMSRCVFLFEILRVFFINRNIYIFRYFSFSFLRSTVKNHIYILQNPNICFNSNNKSNIQALIDNVSHIYRDSNSKVLVRKDHEYYYQMQTQLFVSRFEKCHFFIWTMKDYCLIEVKANKILQSEIISKSTLLFQKCDLARTFVKILQ